MENNIECFNMLALFLGLKRQLHSKHSSHNLVLHFELFYKGEVVNPEEYYNKSISEL